MSRRTIICLIISLVLASNLNCLGRQSQTDSLSVAVYALPRYTRKEMRVHRFLWDKWRRRQPATAELTIFAMDTGNIFTVRMQRDSNQRWIITEHVRHYSALPGAPTEPTELVATGTALRRVRLRNGTVVVRLVSDQGKTVPLFEYLG